MSLVYEQVADSGDVDHGDPIAKNKASSSSTQMNQQLSCAYIVFSLSKSLIRGSAARKHGAMPRWDRASRGQTTLFRSKLGIVNLLRENHMAKRILRLEVKMGGYITRCCNYIRQNGP